TGSDVVSTGSAGASTGSRRLSRATGSSPRRLFSASQLIGASASASPGCSTTSFLPKEKTRLRKPAMPVPSRRHGRERLCGQLRAVMTGHQRLDDLARLAGGDCGERETFGASETFALDQDRLARTADRRKMPAIGRLAHCAQPRGALLYDVAPQ